MELNLDLRDWPPEGLKRAKAATKEVSRLLRHPEKLRKRAKNGKNSARHC